MDRIKPTLLSPYSHVCHRIVISLLVPSKFACSLFAIDQIKVTVIGAPGKAGLIGEPGALGYPGNKGVSGPQGTRVGKLYELVVVWI